MKRALISLGAILWASCAFAGSTINPAQPAQNSSLSSAVVRGNFAAAYNDINKILGGYAGSTAPSSPTVFQDWLDTSASPAVWKKRYNTGWGIIGTFNLSTGVFSGSSLTVGSTPIIGGVAGRVLYDNAGLLGEYSTIPATLLPVVTNASGSPSATAGVMKCDGTTVTCASGIVTAIGSAATTINVGVTTVSGSVQLNGLLYTTAGSLVGNLATANSGLLVTDGSGVPSISAAIPNGVTATTQISSDNSTKLATTAFVQSVAGVGSVSSVFGRIGAVAAQSGDYSIGQITGSGTFAGQNFATPPIIGGTTPNAATFTSLTANATFNAIGAFQINGNAMTFPASPANLLFKVGNFVAGNCLQASGTVGGVADAGAACGSGGSGGGSTATTQDFLAGTNFTPGTTTTLTLASNPFSAAAATVLFDGVVQSHNTWALSGGNLVTFNAAIPLGVQVVEAQWISTSLTAGTVSSVSVVSANGFAGSVANPTTTPAITISTSITGILQGNGTAISAAATSGSGSVVLASSPTIASPTFTGTAAGTNVIPLAVLQNQAANTVNGNWGGTTGAVTANVMPSCADSGGNHLNYVLGTGITCGTGSGSAITSLTGDVTGTGPGAAATTIAANAVTYAKFQQVAASSLVGNSTGSLANAGGVTLGSTLAFSGSALQTAAITGDVTTSANSFATTVVKLQGRAVTSSAPSDGQVLVWVAANSDWEPNSAPSGNVPTGGTTGQVLAKIDPAPFNTRWIDASGTGTVTSVTCGAGLSGGTITGIGTCALTAPVTASNGGTGNTSNTNHGVMIGAGSSNLSASSAGTTDFLFTSNGASADPSFKTINLGTSAAITGNLKVSNSAKFIQAVTVQAAIHSFGGI